ncbi:NgoMIV family type II restriction endonuclease [Rhodococcus sp. HNM0563]|uniref:NgoMIV family type II restriction endonuclease n=1 Tax=Rhodococcus sp. HNM0563 TaxID=2716339 RepID=UPI0032166D16
MTAPFAAELCGYRPTNGNPSTSDNNDKGSIELGHALFEALGVPKGTPGVEDIGSAMEQKVADHLSKVRPDLVVAQSRSAIEFEQYKHLNVFKTFTKNYKGPAGELDKILAELPESPELKPVRTRLLKAKTASERDHELVTQLQEMMPEESFLKIDVALAPPEPADRLLVALSSKWSLRTDRAQDCVSQGSKLVSLRRGHMPHYAVVTMEPRPAMLKYLAYGSGAVDCVYHLALPELLEATDAIDRKRGPKGWSPRKVLLRMVAQRRVRPYEDLVAEVQRLTAWNYSPSADAPDGAN